MSESIELKKSKDRSPGFPFINLEKALERARLFYAQEKRGVAPYHRAVMHWKYSDSSSGGLQTVAALKSYGLLVEVGGTGKGRQLQLSDLALRILLDQRPDSQERAEFIRQAACAPNVAAEVYGKWPDGLPSDSTINHYLVLDKKFNEATAVAALRIIKENQALAKLDGSDVLSSISKKVNEDVMESTQQIRDIPPGDVLTASGMAPKPSLNTPQAHKPQMHTEQHLHLDGKTVITLHFSDTPTAAVYEYLSAITKFKADQLKQAPQTDLDTRSTAQAQ